MKKFLIAVVATSCVVPAFAADVGVSINVDQPGLYGQINIGNVAPPQVIYAQPVIVQRAPEYRGGPLYLHVPPGHEKHWNKHCAEYNACGRPVYFVREDWYNNEYAPRHGHGHGHGDDDGGDEHDHGHGKGHGNGHGHGHKDKDD
jgi:hypothetical protein